LLFQLLDKKQECYKIFCEGELVDDYRIESLSHTWSPASHLEGEEIEYAQIWCGGKTLSQACPPELSSRWESVNKKAMAYLRTFEQSKINLRDVCFYDLVPKKFLLEFYEVKNEISRFVFKNYGRPKNYEFMRDLCFLLKRIESNDLNLDFNNIDYSDNKVRSSISKIKKHNNKIIYDPWKTVTGRLTTKKNSFPILTLNRELRSLLVPKNDVFVELDFNSAELRVLLGLLNQPQPEEDIHTWISKNVFHEKYNREETKKKVFAWLYNPKAKNKKLNEYLDRDKLYEEYFKTDKVKTPYKREICVEKDKAVNYLIQSSASDMLLNSAVNVSKKLTGKKSFVSFCIHDSIVIDLSTEEKDSINALAKIFSRTKFGDLKVNLSIGKNFGNMRKVL